MMPGEEAKREERCTKLREIRKTLPESCLFWRRSFLSQACKTSLACMHAIIDRASFLLCVRAR